MLMDENKLEKIHTAVRIGWGVLHVITSVVLIGFGCTVGAFIIDLFSTAASGFELAVMAFLSVTAMFEGIALGWYIMYTKI